MTISIIRLPHVPQLWDGCDVQVPEDEYHARLNRYLYEWRYRYEQTINNIIGLSSPLTTKGDLWGFSNHNARFPVGPDGTVVTADSSAALGVSYKPDSASDRWAWVFGNGEDGSAHADGSTAVPGMTRSGSIYTLTRSVAFTDFTVDAGVTVRVEGKGIILVKDTLTLNGSINADGVFGLAPYTADFYGSRSGGGNSNTAGTSLGNALGGTGGQGGANAGGPGTGGGPNGGIVTGPTSSTGGRAFASLLQAALSGTGAHSTVAYAGGTGGGGGQGPGGGSNIGGHGGAPLGVAARIIAGSGTGVISSNGMNGQQGAFNPCGGGGGGGGGVTWIITTTTNFLSFISNTVTGGLGGAGVGVGKDGLPGADGTKYVIILG